MPLAGPAFFGAVGGGGGSPVVTLNPADMDSDITLSPGNFQVVKGGADRSRSVRATLGRNGATDDGYFEVRVDDGLTSTFMLVGLAPLSVSVASGPGVSADSWAYYQDTGEKYTNNVLSAFGASWKSNGDIVMCAMKAGKVWWGRNGTWVGDPAAGTGEAFSGLTGTLYPMLTLHRATPQAHRLTARFHPSAFTYGPPSGFGAWDR